MASLRRAARIALGDARQVMGRAPYLVAALGPLLLGVFITALVVVAVVALSLVEASQPEVSPMGTGQVAVVGLSGLPDDARAQVEAVLDDAPTLEAGDRGILGWTRRGKRWLQRARGDVAPNRETPAAEDTREPILWVQVDGDAQAVAPLVPGSYDAALALSPGEAGIEYEILSDPAILYSRVMERRIQSVLTGENRRGLGEGARVHVDDRAAPGVDLWLANALLLILGLGAAYTYHGVAVQSVASVLAGERDRRTLEVLLSLPISNRELVWGKLLALVLAILAPTALWTTVGAWAIASWLGVAAHVPRLLVLGVALILPLTGVGLTISATAPTVQMAQNRLGLANLAVFIGGILLFFGAEALGLGAASLLSGALAFASAAPGGLVWGAGFFGISLAATSALVEISARFMRATPD